jgi:hypothetical protein
MSSLSSGLLRKPATTPGAKSDPALGLPTRSDIEGWTAAINDLSLSAATYRAVAQKLEATADTHCQQLLAPGGTRWAGQSADTAQEASYADRGVVYRAAGHLREMAKVADLGAQNLMQARGSALEAISEAEGDDFVVSDDLSVADKRRYTSRAMSQYLTRQAKADEHHGYIAMRAGVLVSQDAEVGSKLTAGATELDEVIPRGWNQRGAPTPVNDAAQPSLVHSVDFTEDVGPPHPPQEPAPPGKEWHYYVGWGWRMEDALQPCDGQKQFWDLTLIAGGLAAATGGGLWGVIGGIPTAGAAIHDLEQCAPPG